MSYLFLALGLWMAWLAWQGILPEGPAVWGKNESGEKMHAGQRLLFRAGAFVFVGLALLFYLDPHN
jgi:hypothetical protein